MALSRTILRSTLNRTSSPASGVGRANRLICADARDGMFVTVLYAQIDTATGEVTYVNAGHMPPVLYRAGEEHFVTLEGRNLALGIDPEAQFVQRTARMAEGDILLLITDGVTDAVNANNERSGSEHLHEVVSANRRRPATRVKLRRLEREQTRSMLAAMLQEQVSDDLLNAIYDETERNPFFVEEVCKALIEEGQLSYNLGATALVCGPAPG